MRERQRHASRFVRAALLALCVLLVGYLAGVGAAALAERAGLIRPKDEVAEPTPGNTGGKNDATAAAGQTSDAAQGAVPAPPEVAYTTWDEAESPNYYRVVGPAQVGVQPAAGTVAYGELDAWGRATGAVALVTYDSMEEGRARQRADVSGLEPSGWGHNQEVDIAMPDGSLYHGLLYNRSHLVAKSLGGDEDLRNLICGTRTQNVGANANGSEGGMAYAEGLARTWLEAHPDGQLYYAATPVYAGDEPLARSVVVDVRSSDGSVDQRIEVYNAARGFALDYATGAYEVTEPAAQAAEQIRAHLGVAGDVAADGPATEVAQADDGPAQPVTPTGSAEGQDGERKVIVTGSGKAYHHDETCRGLVNARSMEWVSVSEAEAMGRHPCGICGG